MKVLTIAFWCSSFLILYTYIMYPLLLVVFAKYIGSRRYKDRKECNKAELPMISMVIAAYNEEKVIEEKILNSLKIDYPRERIEFLFGSDGSTDRTNEIIARHSREDGRIKLIAYPERRGKASVINMTVAVAGGDIVVFSDANTIYEIDAIKRLIDPFSHSNIGCVCGKLIITKPTGATSNDDLYWRYETWIKRMENRLSGVLGANGGIYAVRKALFHPIPENTIIDDFVIGMRVREQGYLVRFAEDAIAREDTAESDRAEFRRRIRIGAGNFQSIALLKKLLLPREGFFAFQFWSHKILRWCVPFFLITAFLSNFFLLGTERIYQVIFACQLSFYALAFIGYAAGGKSLFFRIPSFFVSMNFAFFVGFIRFAFNTQKGTWERTERLANV